MVSRSNRMIQVGNRRVGPGESRTGGGGRSGAERAHTMRGRPITAPMRRVLVVIAVILVVAVGLIVMSFQTWEMTLGKWSASTAAEVVTAQCVVLHTTFGEERPLMLRYLAVPQPSTLADVQAHQAQFTRQSAQLRPETAAGKAALAQATAGETGAYSAFQQAQRLATGSPSGARAAIGPLDARSTAVSGSLSTLLHAETGHEIAIRRQATAAARANLRFELISGVVTVLLAIGFACYVVRVLGRGHRRERELTVALGRLGDRDKLLARLRSTSSGLGGGGGGVGAGGGGRVADGGRGFGGGDQPAVAGGDADVVDDRGAGGDCRGARGEHAGSVEGGGGHRRDDAGHAGAVEDNRPARAVAG